MVKRSFLLMSSRTIDNGPQSKPWLEVQPAALGVCLPGHGPKYTGHTALPMTLPSTASTRRSSAAPSSKLKEALFAIQSREPNRIPASFCRKESSSSEAILAPPSASGSRGTSNTTTPASTSHSLRSTIPEVREQGWREGAVNKFKSRKIHPLPLGECRVRVSILTRLAALTRRCRAALSQRERDQTIRAGHVLVSRPVRCRPAFGPE